MRSSRLLFANGFVLLSTLAIAQQPPQAFSYQAVARNSSGHAIVGFATSARFALHQDSPTGPVVYEEEHAITTNDQGLFTVEVGKGTPLSGVVASFGEVEFGLMRVFLEVSLDLDNTGVFTSMGAQELLSVPYALHAGSSSNVPNGTEVGQIMHWSGSAWVADSGLYVHEKRFGIGITDPESPLGIAADSTDGSAIKLYQASSSTGPGPFNPLAWNINLNPSNSDIAGFSIDDATSGIGSSRLFIANSSGNVGIGNTDPGAPLSIKNRSDLYEEFKNGDIPSEDDFVISTGGNTGLSIDQDTIGGYASRLSINSSTGHVGIGTNDPPAPLAIVSKSVLKQFFQTGDFPTQSQFGFTQTDTTGFGIEQGIPGSMTSRLFIQSSSGNVGIGTTHPEAPLAIESRDYLYEKFQNGDIPDEQDFAISSGGNTGLSIDQDTTGGSVSRLFIQAGTGHVGVGSDDPPAALSIETRETLKTYFETGDVPTQDRFGISTGATGFDIGQGAPNALQSRLFIESATGNVGIGTTEPEAQLEVFGHSQGSNVGILMRNTASTVNEGWRIGVLVDDDHPGNVGIQEKGAGGDIERMTIRPGGNVGINEKEPDVTFHVSRDPADPDGPVDLRKGTGFICVGTVRDRHLVMDSHQIQVRHTEFQGGGSGLNDFVASELGLQPLGGDILIHGGDALDEHKIAIDSLGNMGLGTLTPSEKLDVNGAIRIRDTDSNPEDGTIRYTGSDFEGRQGGQWRSLTTHTNTDGLWEAGSPGEISYAPVGLDARVGIGTTTPDSKLHVTGAADGGNVSIMVENLGSSPDGGWLMSAVDDNAVPERMKTFAIHEKTGVELTERITVLAGGKVGINEPLPDTKLHVSRDLTEPGAALGLIEGTGIAVIGPMTDNVVFDYRGLQARHGEYVGGGSTLSLATADLNLQRLGGAILIHGDDALIENQVSVTGDGKIGVGKTATEKLDINGAITVGTTSNATPADGTIRYTGTDFEGRSSGEWVPFDVGWRRVVSSNDIHHNAKVGIGITQPTAMLHVRDSDASTGNAIAANIHNEATTSSSSADDHRVALQLSSSGSWGGAAASKNIGLYVKEVSGQTEASSNIAAVLNGNTVIGDVTNGQLVGTGGSRVLSIQNGTAPAAPSSNGSGLPDGGVQLYSSSTADGISTLHVMRGNGEVVKLYKETALTTADTSPIGPGVDPSTALLIENMRTRINELEAKLQAMGLLATP